MDKIKIDRKILFALASDTRLEILKRLDKRRMTLSELSKELNLSKTTVKEHLDKLIEVELIRKVDENRKWIYYELTKKGKKILHPSEKTMFLFIISVIISTTLTVMAILKLIITREEVKPPEQIPSTPPPITTVPPQYPEYFPTIVLTAILNYYYINNIISISAKTRNLRRRCYNNVNNILIYNNTSLPSSPINC